MDEVQQRFQLIREVAEKLGCPKSVFNAQTWERVKDIPKEQRTPGVWLWSACGVVTPLIVNTSLLQFHWLNHEEWVSVQAVGEPSLVEVWVQVQYHLFHEETYQTSHRILYQDGETCKVEVTSLRSPLS